MTTEDDGFRSKRTKDPEAVSNAEMEKAVTEAALKIDSIQFDNPDGMIPVLQMDSKLPASQQFRAYFKADLLAHTNDVDVEKRLSISKSEPGKTYTGPIIGYSDSSFWQDIGSLIVQHEKRLLVGDLAKRRPVAGETLEISYKNGAIGLIRQAQSGLEKQQKPLQKDYGDRGR
ncbi:KfrB domain-containing protein [Solidesulfovibrio alcoholivorans]|uniref:KfrB domain-containing protein n=1 Tax=Solidesulfovibrio alcoholivorans TaxID=81406 RepID=UPI0012EC6E48|nr:hypothetical protein [Solidesulfovibrio alcoholivorans]